MLRLFFGENNLLSTGIKMLAKILKHLCIFGCNGVRYFVLGDSAFSKAHHDLFFQRVRDDEDTGLAGFRQGDLDRHFYGVGSLCIRIDPHIIIFAGQALLEFFNRHALLEGKHEGHGTVKHVNIRCQPVHIPDDGENALAP